MLGAKVYGISKSRMVIIPNPVVRTKKAYCNTEKRWVVGLFLSSVGPICDSFFFKPFRGLDERKSIIDKS